VVIPHTGTAGESILTRSPRLPGSPCVLPQETVPDLIKKLSEGEEGTRKQAADDLVLKGATAKEPLRKAHEKAGSDRKPLFEEVLLRIEAGSDQTYAKFGECSVSIVEGSVTPEVPPGSGPAQRVKVVIQLDNQEKSPVTVAMAKATLHTMKGNMGLLVRGSKGEPFSRQADPNVPKSFEYGAVIPPRFPVGSLATISIELEAGGKKKVVRTPIFTIEKKD
jgi:hypothetical protein